MEIVVKLTFMSGPSDGNSIQISLKDNMPEIIIGRSEECTVCIPNDAEISRKHARLRLNGQCLWQLEDLNSTNGTYVGEFIKAKRISIPVQLEYGEIFRLGRTCLRLETVTQNEDN